MHNFSMLKLAVLRVTVSIIKPQKSNEITKPIYSDVSSCEASWPKFRIHFLSSYAYFTTPCSVATATGWCSRWFLNGESPNSTRRVVSQTGTSGMIYVVQPYCLFHYSKMVCDSQKHSYFFLP